MTETTSNTFTRFKEAREDSFSRKSRTIPSFRKYFCIFYTLHVKFIRYRFQDENNILILKNLILLIFLHFIFR